MKMTGKKYIGYSVEDLLHDQEFVLEVKNMKTTEEWEQFLQSHIESKNNIIQARKIIQVFQVNDEKLSEEKKYKLWKNVSHFNVEFVRNYKQVRIKSFVKIAASIILIVSLGSLLYLKSKHNEHKYEFSESRNDLKNGNPLLVLSNGEEVKLEKKESKITVLKGRNAIEINNDSIVENKPSIDKTSQKVKFNEVIIPFGKKTKLVLGDGTKVWLNAGSRFAFPPQFERKRRVVYLKGEAYFEVARNINKPFIVSTDNIEVKVLGTKFNICAYNSDSFSEAVLLEGSINIWDKNKLFKDKILMVPNQIATYSSLNKTIEVNKVDAPEMYISWVDGWYQFTNENLEHVLNKLERYYNTNFDYDRDIISKVLPVSGKLDLKDSLEDVMVVLSKVAKFDYHISGNHIIISK